MNNSIYKKYTYIYFSSFRLNVKNPPSLFYNILLFILRLVKRLLMLEFNYPKLGTVFYFEPSLNNRKSLEGTKKNIPDNLIVSCPNYYHFFPEAWVYLYSCLHIFSFFKFYKSLNKEDSELVRFYFLDFVLSMGFKIVIDKCLQKNAQLKAIVMANDHLVIAMCLKDLASKYGIKTIYTQHASITERFPPLNFDYSFLDGTESFEKYEKIGNISGNVYLSGSPRFDEIYTIVPETVKEFTVGLAINSLDNILKVQNLCTSLIHKGFTRILLRPHPRMEKQIDWGSFINMGVKFSMPSEETSFHFLNRISCLISNESGVHLDAAMLGVPSIQYNLSEHGLLDWYGYVRTGLIPLASNNNELFYYLNHNKHVKDELVRYYVASHRTQLQGRVGEVIGEYIIAIINDKSTEILDDIYFSKSKDSYFMIRKL